MKQQQKHPHKLKRYTYKSGNTVYFCTLPDCHFKIETALILGKTIICNLCGNEFTANEYTVKLARPHCDKCSKQKVKGVDGKNHFIRKTHNTILPEIAQESSEDLRNRLSFVTTVVNEDDL